MANSSSDDEIKPAAGAGSAEERCPICLEDYQDKAFIDACFHAFCFECIVKAVEVTSGRCPMCKTTFDTIIHNVRAIDDYDRFKVQPKPTPPASVSLAAIQEEAFRTFRGYRTTRLPGQPSRQESTDSTSSDRARHTATTVPAGTSSSTSSQGQLPVSSRSAPSRKRASTQSRSSSRKPAALERRRAVYSTGLRALPIGTSNSRRIRIRDISASFFRSNPASTHRLFPWLTREFKVLVGDEHVEFMLQLMQSLIDKIDMESAEFGNHLEPFLHEKMQHFMHELISFAKSPYDMIAYDNKVRYDWPETHPQAQEQSSEGPETVGTGSQPGPSGIQQRVLEELMLSRWDNSPPLHSGSQSPTIVIQDSSDSEPDLHPDHTPSPGPHSELPTEATGETIVEQSEDPAAPSTTLNTTQRDVQTPQIENQEQLHVTLNKTSTETLASEEHEQSSSMLEGTSANEHLANSETMFESCPEVSSSAALVEKPVALNDEVSSTSGSLEPTSLPSKSVDVASQPHPEMLPHEEATSLQSRDLVQDAVDDDDFEISLYAEDGGTSLGGEGSTPTSDILKRSRRDRDKASRVSKLKKKSHHSDTRSKEKEHKNRHSESKSSSGSGQKEYESSSKRHKLEKDRERYHHRQSRHRRSRSRSHSRSRSYRSHRHDSSDEYSSRSRHRSRERDYSHKRKPHRSRSRSGSYSSNDDASARIKSTVVVKVGNKWDKDERESRHRRERSRRDRSESQSPNRRISSHYRGDHDYDRRSSNYDREHHSRGRLYSDDVWSEEKHSSHSSSRSTRCSTASSHSSQRKMNQRTITLSLSDEEERKSKSPNETKLLAQELSEVDKQIHDNKKELLKSMLRKERLELLQKSLHGGESLVSSEAMLQLPSDVSATRTTGEMEKELEVLNRAITDGKKQLLRVMKKMEEEQVEMNQD